MRFCLGSRCRGGSIHGPACLSEGEPLEHTLEYVLPQRLAEVALAVIERRAVPTSATTRSYRSQLRAALGGEPEQTLRRFVAGRWLGRYNRCLLVRHDDWRRRAEAAEASLAAMDRTG